MENKISVAFDAQSIEQKRQTIEAVIDENIRPMLVMDGGNLEIVDLKVGDDGTTDLYIRYIGACSGCASSSTGTLFAIESMLKKSCSPSIRVLPI